MSSVIIGNVTPAIQPGSMTLVRADKISAHVQTYSGVAYFGWTPTIVGKVIELTWNLLSAADFASLDALYQADAEVVFKPGEGSTTYNVNVIGLDGSYQLTRQMRGDVKLQLLIMSVVS